MRQFAVHGDSMPNERKLQPRQRQHQQPGREYKMRPRPKAQDETYRASEKLRNKVAIITGGDSGIGRAVAIAFAKEGADVAVVYLEEEKDANETKRLVEEHGRKCLLIAGDVGQEEFCRKAIAKSFNVSFKRCRDVWLRRPTRPTWSAGGNRAELRVPRI